MGANGQQQTKVNFGWEELDACRGHDFSFEMKLGLLAYQRSWIGWGRLRNRGLIFIGIAGGMHWNIW